MKKNFLLLCICTGILSMVCATAQAAQRDDVIAQSLDCMQKSYTAGAVDYKDICVINNGESTVKRSSVKVKTGPIIVESRTVKKKKAISAPASSEPLSFDEPMSDDSPLTAGTLSKAREDAWSYTYFNFRENPANMIEAGVEVFDYTYREEGFMKLDGSMKGVYGVYTHRFHENAPVSSIKEVFSGIERLNFIRLDSRYSRGTDIKYRSEGTGEHENETHFAHETRFVVGADYPLSGKSVTLSPYGGVGYRYLKDDNGGELTTTGHWGYDRESNYVYIPLGVDVTKVFNSRWKAILNLEYDIFVDGQQKSHFEDDPNGIYSQTLANDQNDGYGYRGSVKIVKETDIVNFVVEPFTRFWHIKQSEVGCTIDTCGIEPNNRTWEFGVKAGIQF